MRLGRRAPSAMPVRDVVQADLLAALRGAVGDATRVRHRLSDRIALANDASHYLLTPQAVVVPADAFEVARLLQVCATRGVALTFRSGGTSLSGQAVTDGVLLDVRRHFRDVEILDDGLRVRVQPGVTVRQVNLRLAPFGRKLGPDPASEAACTIGGVIANNSSGMACGTRDNAYRTLESLVFVLPSGTVVDSGASDADERLRALEPAVYAGLCRLRDRVRSSPASVSLIQAQFAMKNTMGYGLNAFLDHATPVEMLTHLVVGSEGTLAFVAQATFRTVAVLPHAATGLLLFRDLAGATRSLETLVATGPATIELLDAASLRVARQDPRAAGLLGHVEVRDHAGLLVEYQQPSAQALAEAREDFTPVLDSLGVVGPVSFSTDASTRGRLWQVRKGLYAAIASARQTGTTALLEDVVVPVGALLATCAGLSKLFVRHGYPGSVIFGHAKEGNIHFMLTDRFDEPDNRQRYRRFTDDMVELVLGHGGSLKAEHGTGRNMAPYVARQYGPELYEVMRELKRLCDPTGLLNPGVILNEDPDIHLRHLKRTPAADEEIDRCVECGYCEPVCPSRDLTTTPRQRIVLRRAMADAQAGGDVALLADLQAAYEYDAVQTCAVDGMCQTACPVGINTGDLMKRLRLEQHSRLAERAGLAAANHWSATTRAASGALQLAAATPAPLAATTTRLARRLLDPDIVPMWGADLPAGGIPRPISSSGQPEAVYFSACVGSIFGASPSGRGVNHALTALCERAGVSLTVPDGIRSLCCGTPWRSKGLQAGYAAMQRRVLPALWHASRQGTLPVVCDASSCTEGLTQMVANAAGIGGRHYAELKVFDAVEFVNTHVLSRLTVRTRLLSLALHPTCASTRRDDNAALRALAAAIADDVVIPAGWGCCGFAGDRGLLHPELTASATQDEVADLTSRECTAYASSNRTCEIGMSRASGHEFRHLIELVEELTR